MPRTSGSTRARTAIVAALAVTLAGCAWWAGNERLAPVSEYVAAAVRELRKGNFEQGEDIMLRARGRFPENEAVLRWSAEIKRMQGRHLEALDLLLELTRSTHLITMRRRELSGQIGDLLFALGKYGESAHFLRTGMSGEAIDQRQAKEVITFALPYARRQIQHRPVERRLFGDTWPQMLCRFGTKDRVCVFDTGSTMCTLAMSLARDVGVTDIREFGLVRDSLGRKHSAWIGVLPELAIGDVEVGPLPVVVVSDERLTMRDSFGGPESPPLAVIGMDVLSQFRFVLDMPQRLTRFDRPQGLEENSTETCLVVEGCLLMPLQLDGVRMWFIVDTAASHSSLTQQGLDVLPGGDHRPTPDFRHPKSLGGRSFISRKVTGLVLQTSAVKFTGVELPIVERLSAGPFPVHGVLGADLLKRCRMTLDRGVILLEQVSGRR